MQYKRGRTTALRLDAEVASVGLLRVLDIGAELGLLVLVDIGVLVVLREKEAGSATERETAEREKARTISSARICLRYALDLTMEELR